MEAVEANPMEAAAMVVAAAVEAATTSNKAAVVEGDGKAIAFSPYSTTVRLDLERTER